MEKELQKRILIDNYILKEKKMEFLHCPKCGKLILSKMKECYFCKKRFIIKLNIFRYLPYIIILSTFLYYLLDNIAGNIIFYSYIFKNIDISVIRAYIIVILIGVVFICFMIRISFNDGIYRYKNISIKKYSKKLEKLDHKEKRIENNIKERKKKLLIF